MSSVSRRRLLACGGSVGAAVLAGCAGGGRAESTPGGSGSASNSTERCTATEPPKPTSAAAEPRDYPEAPAELTTRTVESFVAAFERAYQYNRALADDPRKIGRLNELDVRVSQTTVESDGSAFTVEVSGSSYFSIATSEGPEKPTPTVTPLPMGRRPFGASYVVTPASVRRDDTVVRCL
jgi:hypothetical protein